MSKLVAQEWRKSSYTNDNDCVEVMLLGGGTAIRDSKDPDGGRLTVSSRGWRGLLDAVVSGSQEQH
jgi:hypothetical protein